MNIGYIYLIKNIVNGKIYVGKTTASIEERFKKHLFNAEKKINHHLYDAINCYGKENFKCELLDIVEDDEDIDYKETMYIFLLHSTDPKIGYNMTYGGNGGRLVSAEKRKEAAIKAANTRKNHGYQFSPETRKKISLHHNTIITPEIANKISNTLKRKYSTQEIIAHVPIKCGKDHWGYADIDRDKLLKDLLSIKTIKQIAKHFHVSTQTIANKSKQYFDKTPYEIRKAI